MCVYSVDEQRYDHASSETELDIFIVEYCGVCTYTQSVRYRLATLSQMPGYTGYHIQSEYTCSNKTPSQSALYFYLCAIITIYVPSTYYICAKANGHTLTIQFSSTWNEYIYIYLSLSSHFCYNILDLNEPAKAPR